MLPFFLIPIGGPATAISLRIVIGQIREKRTWSWALWPVAVLLSITLLIVIAFVVVLIAELAFHKTSK